MEKKICNNTWQCTLSVQINDTDNWFYKTPAKGLPLYTCVCVRICTCTHTHHLYMPQGDMNITLDLAFIPTAIMWSFAQLSF